MQNKTMTFDLKTEEGRLQLLGAKIRFLRQNIELTEITQKEFAKRLFFEQSIQSRIETGEYELKVNSLHILIEMSGLTANHFFSGVNFYEFCRALMTKLEGFRLNRG